ncbi:MAG TPA: S41 family peptidase, partial [Gemmatimonadales bacterium]|nr:S41 family peptidase [Gemmatimonadales bacterium]
MRFKSHRFFLAVPPIALAAFLAGRMSAGDGPRLFQTVLSIIGRDAVDSMGVDTLYQLAARGLVASLGDPYAGLQSKEEFARFSRNTLGNSYGGLGLRIVRTRGQLAVMRVIPGGPASAAGVRQGDRIVAVNDSSALRWDVDRASSVLTGVPGTAVRVAFQDSRTGTRYDRTLTRAVINPPSVPFEAMLPGEVGYLPLQRFSDHSAMDVAAALTRLERAGARRLVLDLRGNPGGDLQQAAQLAGLFLEPGATVVRVQYRRYADTLRADNGPAIGIDLPIAVLVDSQSASASEILAGALQDHDRGLVVGTSSYGKGLVQNVYRLTNGWVLRLTSGHWYTPSGRLIQRTHADSMRTGPRPIFHSDAGRTVLGGGGIAPDVEVGTPPVPPAEEELGRVLSDHARDVNRVLDAYAGELESGLKPGFEVEPAWRDELVRRLRAAGVPVVDSLARASSDLLDRLLEGRAGMFVDSDSSDFIRGSDRDTQLARALELLRQVSDQRALLTIAASDRQP